MLTAIIPRWHHLYVNVGLTEPFFTLLGCNSTGMPRTDKIRATVNPSEALGVDRSLALDYVLHDVTPSLGNRVNRGTFIHNRIRPNRK